MKFKKSVKRAAVAAASLACILVCGCAVMWLWQKWRAAEARARVAEERLREARVRIDYAPYVGAGISLTPDQTDDLSEIYEAIASAYRRRDIDAMRTGIRLLPECNDHLPWDDQVDSPLRQCFRSEVMNTKPVPEFGSRSDFEKYMDCTLELAWFYASLYGRRKAFEHQAGVESWVYFQLSRFREKFKSESKAELEKSAERLLRELEAQIESPGGYTRRAIRSLIVSDLGLAAAMRPGSGISRANAVLLGRGCATGLLKAGYKPKWLDEEFPLQEKEKPHDATVKRIEN